MHVECVTNFIHMKSNEIFDRLIVARLSCQSNSEYCHLLLAAVMCGDLKQYHSCRSPCVATCRNFGKSTANICQTMQCVEGCFCPDGLVLNGNLFRVSTTSVVDFVSISSVNAITIRKELKIGIERNWIEKDKLHNLTLLLNSSFNLPGKISEFEN